eukprot:scaffold21534_cov105-Phaeocystis_antarctica.AAC.1
MKRGGAKVDPAHLERVRRSTHKCQIASAVHHRRRHRTFDVVGAYLKGKFTDNEVVYARPPPTTCRTVSSSRRQSTKPKTVRSTSAATTGAYEMSCS